MLEFLGNTGAKGSMAGMSQSPLVQSLSALRGSINKEFRGIPFREGIAEILMELAIRQYNYNIYSIYYCSEILLFNIKNQETVL